MTKAKRNGIIVESALLGGWSYSEKRKKKAGKYQDSRVRVVEYRILIKFKFYQ